MPRSCPHCQNLTNDLSPRCVHCGRLAEPKKERKQHTAVRCAGCDGGAEIVRVATVEIDRCQTCAGLWFDLTELTRLREVFRRQQSDAVEELSVLLGGSGKEPKKTYLACPVCQQIMNRQCLLVGSGIVVHRCGNHGTWVSGAGLRRLMEIIASGDEHRLQEDAARRVELDRQEHLRDLQSQITATRAEMATWARRLIVLDFLL